MTPHRGKHHSLPFLPSTPSLVSSRTLGGLFEMTHCPLRALDSPCAMLPELQRNKDRVRYATLGLKVPGHRQKRLKKNLESAFVNNAF